VLVIVLGGWSLWWLSPTIDEWSYLHHGTKFWLGEPPELIAGGTLPLPFWIQGIPGALYLKLRYGGVPGGIDADFGKTLPLTDQYVLLYGVRWVNLVMAGITAIWAVWWLTRRQFGPAAAGVSALLYAVEPNLLASEIVGLADAAILPMTLLAIVAYDDYLKAPRAWKLATTGALLGLALGMKVSAFVPGLLVLGAFAAVGLVTRGRDAPSTSVRLSRLFREVVGMALQLALIAAIAILVSWAANGFLTDSVVYGKSTNPRSIRFLTALGMPVDQAKSLVAQLRQIRIPAPLGVLRYQAVTSMTGFPVTFLGRTRMRGPWYYYPYIFAMTTHLVLLLAAIGSLALGRVRRSPVTLSALLLLGLSCTLKLHGGPRYFLLLYSLLVVLGGAGLDAALRLVRPPWARLVLGTTVAFASLGLTVSSVPELMTHTSPLWGGDRQGYLYASTNYDMGQGLYLAFDAADRAGLRPISFIHTGDPYYGVPRGRDVIPHSRLRAAVGESSDTDAIPQMLSQMHGRFVAVSVLLLYHFPSVYSPDAPLYSALAALRPDGRLTNTFFYFDLRSDERFAALQRLVEQKRRSLPVSEVDP
jgi:hypothetical protein